jgi:hypothetical protein
VLHGTRGKLICNQKVTGSIPVAGTISFNNLRRL